MTACSVFTAPSEFADNKVIKTSLDPLVANTGQPFSEVARKTDVIAYEIDLELFPGSKSISGFGSATFTMLEPSSQLELKLDPRYLISRVEVDGEPASYVAKNGSILIKLKDEASPKQRVKASVFYSGQPHIALNAPWDGGFVWDKTPSGEDWIATAVQGEGCDVFWPCKDHFADKADSTSIKLTVPSNLTAVTNGKLQKTIALANNRTRFEWLLSVPASDYNIALNVGPYGYIKRDYKSSNGQTVPIEFWPLKENQKKAESLVEDDLVQQLAFFEKHLGPYPWGTEKLGFVETPHLGMEHQTVNAYGRNYKRDKHGFDWLLHHELAHEWFGNLMTHERLNDAWLHEGFGWYMQPAYSLYKDGEAAYQHRMYESYLRLKNCKAIVLDGDISSDDAFNSDIYGKGGWVLHTLRWLIGDELFWQASRELVYGQADKVNTLLSPITPRYRNTQDFIDIVNKMTNEDYSWLFDVYMKQASLPELIVHRDESHLALSWKTPNQLPFPMPVPVSIDGDTLIVKIDPQAQNTSLPVSTSSHVIIDPQMSVLRKLPIIPTCEERIAEEATQSPH
ncbi:M1 family metallopeptidase [Glaciecola sp. MH2013]|nr:M1 family metallopeptidase [Glaciecola sp. MH2013]